MIKKNDLTEKTTKKVKNKTAKWLFLFIFLVLVSVFFYFYGKNIGFFPLIFRVEGRSMLPTLLDGDIIECKKYRNDNLTRKEIVVVKHGNILVIKRIIGLPGDDILVQNNHLFVNDEFQIEEYEGILSDTNNWETGFTEEGIELKVPKDKYFILGDNRLRSSDSREYGYVSKNDVICTISYEEQKKNYFTRWNEVRKLDESIYEELAKDPDWKKTSAIFLDFSKTYCETTNNYMDFLNITLENKEINNNQKNQLTIIKRMYKQNMGYCKYLLSIKKYDAMRERDHHVFNAYYNLENALILRIKKLINEQNK